MSEGIKNKKWAFYYPITDSNYHIGNLLFVVLNLNSSIINFDLLFIEIDLHIGSLVLSALCLGIIIATILELIIFPPRKK